VTGLRALRYLDIKREEDPGPTLVETHLAPHARPQGLRILEAHQRAVRDQGNRPIKDGPQLRIGLWAVADDPW
jgi:hypothetical protein